MARSGDGRSRTAATSRGVSSSLLRAGERVLRVPPKLMAGERRRAPGRSARATRSTRWPSRRAAIARPTCRSRSWRARSERSRCCSITARNLVVERTRDASRLRWLLHELDPGTAAGRHGARHRAALDAPRAPARRARAECACGSAGALLAPLASSTTQIARAAARSARLVRLRHAPLLAVPGCGIINAARLLAEVADVGRFPTDAQLANYAGVAPLEASSGRTAGTASTAPATASSTPRFT